MTSADDVDEPITIVEYDPEWPALFTAEAGRIRAALAPLDARIEHFGSTAVPGLAGKPVVDLLVGIAELHAAPPYVERLVALGYENFGEIFIPGRHYLRRRGPPHFNVALTAEGGVFWRRQIELRDYLRAHPAEAAEYARHKRTAFDRGARLFSSYSQAKGGFLAELAERARRWRAALD